MRDRKQQIALTVLEKKRTNCEEWDLLMYFNNKSSNVMVEKPKTDEFFIVPDFQIGKFITLNKVTTPWIKDPVDDTYISYSTGSVRFFKPLSKELTFCKIRFIENHSYGSNLPDNFSTENFSRTLTKLPNKQNVYEEVVEVIVPMFPLWGEIRKSPTSDVFTVTNICFNINSKFYSFPYGNVSTSGGICYGGNTSTFKTAEHFIAQFFTTPFNTDYALNVRRTSSSYKPEFNLDELHKAFCSKFGSESFKINKFHWMDILYYISQITNIEDFNFNNIFYNFATPIEELNND